MSGSPTLFIRETDDDRTLIDPIRLADPDTPFEGSGRALASADPNPCLDVLTAERRWPWQGLRSKFSGQGRRTTEASVMIAVVLSLASLAYQQWQSSHALRGVIAEMNARRSATLPEDFVGLPGHAPAPLGVETRLATSIHDTASADREEAESRGASLIGSNNFEGALTHYQALADLFPNEAVFRDVVMVLKTKLKCAGPAAAASLVCP
jgi:hypothetical protein